ncbi:DDE_3 domain-containing protein [Trichonephila clavata]|uniref:DDE_3 domain-containing protein n=1 Tax=Trichonephila clavata TaxID=2740835 RepID=A0A8X6G902_TRICU|nr:DDE_3 domain-containing protein [Trichonephila clavata]
MNPWISHIFNETVQGGGGSVMVWGLCSWPEMGPLILLDSTITGQRYVNILSNHMHSFMSCEHYFIGRGQFQKYNAPPLPQFYSCYRVLI